MWRRLFGRGAAVLGVLWLCLASGTALAAAPFALGGGGPSARPANIMAQLLVEQPVIVQGGSTTIAIAMTPQPTWHGYWENGGDAGFGMQVEWELPPGVSIGPLAYPVPDTLIIAGLMNHVYERPYALLAPLRIDASVPASSVVAIRGRAQWLACTDKICVPEGGTLSATLRVGAKASTAPSQRFDAWRAALPQPLDRNGTFALASDVEGGALARFAIPLPRDAVLSDPHLFVATSDRVDYAAPQRFSRNGDMLIVETAAAKSAMSGSLTALLRTSDQRGLMVRFRPGAVPQAGEILAGPGTGGWPIATLFLSALSGAILGGILLNLMPCVFPILSLKALSLARAGGDDGTAARREALAYLAGAVMVALMLGAMLMALRAAGQTVGWAFQLQHPVSIIVLLALATAITANLAGLFHLPGVGAGQGLAGQGGVRGGFWTGALAAFVATPCSGPFLGAALGATLALPPWAALPVFGGLGLGLALPFVAVAYIPALRRRLPRPGPWMAHFARWMAVPMALTALALLWLLHRQAGSWGMVLGLAMTLVILAAAFWAGRSGRGALAAALGLALVGAGTLAATQLPPASGAAPLGGALYTDARLAELRAAGRPVFVNFTADWCLTCKANEAAAIDRTVTAAAFRRANVATLTADWTNGDPAITRALARHGRNSVPLYLWYAPGATEPEILPQILTQDMLAARANAARDAR